MKKLNQIWQLLTSPLSKIEDEARREYMTRVIFLMISGGLLITTVVVPVFDFLVGEPEYIPSLVILGTDGLMLVGWFLVFQGHWHISRYVLPVIFLALSGYLIFNTGLMTTGILQLAIAVILTAMLFGNRAQWATVIFSVILYLSLGWFAGERDFEVFFTGGIVVGFSLSGIALLQWFSSTLLTSAIQKAHLAETAASEITKTIRQQAARAEALAAFSNLLTQASKDFQQVLDTAVRQCAELIGDGASIMLYSPSEEFLQLVAVFNQNPDAIEVFTKEMQARPIRANEGHYETVIQTRQPILVPFIDVDSLIKKASPGRREYYKKLPLHSMMLAPLLVQGELLGVIGMARHAAGKDYTPEDLTFLQDMANRSALAMHNSRLYSEVQQKLEERNSLIDQLQEKNIQAETLREITTIVTSGLDQEAIVQQILEQLKRVVQYDSASVWLYRGDIAEVVGWVNLPHGASEPGFFSVSEKEPDYAFFTDETLDYILIDEIQEKYPQFQVPSLSYIHSWLAVPLRARSKLTGFISLDGHNPGFFTEADANLALTFANQVSIALENARLIKGLQEELAERKQAEHALKFSEEKFAKAFNTTSVLNTIENEKGIFIDVNQAFLDALGIEREEVIGHNASSLNLFYNTDDATSLRQEIQNKGALKDFEIRMSKDSGEVAIVLLSTEKITLDGTDYTLTSGLDITERKKTEQALKLSEEKFSKAFNTTPVLSTIENDQNVFIDVNQSFLETFGVTREEAIGSNALDLHMLYDPEDLIELRRTLKEKGSLKDFDIRIRKKTGEIGVIILSSDKFMMDGVEHTLTTGLDITERQKAEEKYRSIYNNSVEGIFQSSENGRFLSVNPAMARIYGYDSPEDMLHNVNDIGDQLYVNPKQREEVRERLSSGERLVGYETLEYRKDGSTFWTSMSAQAIRDDRGEILYYEGLVEDITPRKLAEAEREKMIEELQIKNEELERFTYTVSHDLKSPLITIGGFLGYLEQDALSGNIEQLKMDIQRIQDATQKMQRLLNELLELSRIGRMVNKSEEIPFKVLVDDAMDIVHGQLKERSVIVHTYPNLPTVYGDKPRLTEVMQNLLENATKYMGDQPDPKIEIGQRGEENSKPVFFVKDNGIGIAPEYHEKIFGLFDKLDPNSEGTGVGLALVKRIVEVHGGKIWVESREGQGATFCFTLSRQSDTGKANK